MDRELEQGINIYIKHIRKMSKLTDQQMALLMASHAVENNETLDTLNKISSDIKKISFDIKSVIDGQINHVRKMQSLTDDQIKYMLLKNNNMHEILREGALKKNMKDIANEAKSMHGDPTKFARKVDRF